MIAPPPPGPVVPNAAAPTVIEATIVTHLALDSYARLLDSRLVVGQCPITGRRSRACEAHVKWYPRQRLRVVVISQPNGDFTVRARPIR